MSVDKTISRLGIAVVLIGFMPIFGVAQGQGHGQGTGQEVAASHRNNEESQDSGRNVARRSRKNILFILQDKVINFDGAGQGIQVGTATGKINGVSITNFQFEFFSAFPDFTVETRTGITDPDGDQIIFRMLGEGRFLLEPLQDPTAPAVQVLGPSFPPLGGPVTGTYEVLATSGKYAERFETGEIFPFRAVGYNPNPLAIGGPPSDSLLGAVYTEVFSNRAHDDADDGEGEDAGEE